MQALTSANFNEEVLQSKVPVMVDFYAVWCGPCRNMKPALEELSSEADGKYKIFCVDIDECQELAVEYDINVIPTILVFMNGQIKKRVNGGQNKEKLLSLFNDLE